MDGQGLRHRLTSDRCVPLRESPEGSAPRPPERHRQPRRAAPHHLARATVFQQECPTVFVERGPRARQPVSVYASSLHQSARPPPAEITVSRLLPPVPFPPRSTAAE